MTAGKEHAIHFAEQHKKFCLSFRYNGVNSYLFGNGVEIYKIKAKDSVINGASLCLGNVSKNFSVDNSKNIGLYGDVYYFTVNYDANIYVTNIFRYSDFSNIQKYLMKKCNLKQSLNLLEK